MFCQQCQDLRARRWGSGTGRGAKHDGQLGESGTWVRIRRWVDILFSERTGIKDYSEDSQIFVQCFVLFGCSTSRDQIPKSVWMDSRRSRRKDNIDYEYGRRLVRGEVGKWWQLGVAEQLVQARQGKGRDDVRTFVLLGFGRS